MLTVLSRRNHPSALMWQNYGDSIDYLSSNGYSKWRSRSDNWSTLHCLRCSQYSNQSRVVCRDDQYGRLWSCEDSLREARANFSRSSSWTYHHSQDLPRKGRKTNGQPSRSCLWCFETSFHKTLYTFASVCFECNSLGRAWIHRTLAYLLYDSHARVEDQGEG